MIEERIPKAEQRRNAWRAAALRVARQSPVGALASTQGFVLTHPQAAAGGIDRNEVRRLLRRGAWTAPRRHVLCVLPREGKYVDGHRPEIAAAAVALLRPEVAISHECAALAYGLDVLRMPSLATLTTSSRAHAASRGGAVIRSAALDSCDRSEWFGVPITRCARTVVDLARRSARDGIVVADSALRDEVVTVAELADALARQRGWDGVATARRVLDLASELSESPLESLVRLFLADNDLPLPKQQVWIETYRGWYRVDGLWRDLGVILEVDGMDKYRKPTRKNDDNPLGEEKKRQDALERAGYSVTRVTWADIHAEPAATVARIVAVLSRSGSALQSRRTRFSA